MVSENTLSELGNHRSFKKLQGCPVRGCSKMGLNRYLGSRYVWSQGFPGGSVGKNPLAVQETQERRVWSLGREDSPGGGNGNPLQYSCLGNPMAGYSPWSCKESYMTEHAHTLIHTHTCTHTHTHRKSSVLYIITTNKFICMYLFLSSLSSQEKHSIYSH